MELTLLHFNSWRERGGGGGIRERGESEGVGLERVGGGRGGDAERGRER